VPAPVAPPPAPVAVRTTPSAPPLPPRAATPAAVSAVTPAGPKKDSVELLLEGMPTVQPQQPRTTPQSAGQSSAAYHAEHSVRPAHTSPDDVPKVVVERAPQHQTVRLDRVRLQAVIEQAQAERAARQAPPDPSMPMSLRIAIAVVAGLAVVLGIFLYVRSQPVVATTAPPPPASTSHPVIPLPAAPVAVTATTPTVEPVATTSEPSPSATDTVSIAPSAPPISTGAAPRPRPRPAAPPSPGGTTDLGEFKTTFH
jgi:hypothetical protein